MAKTILSAVAGYIVMAAGVFGLMAVAWFAVGPEGAFRPEVWQVTATWIFLMIVSALFAAVAGGYVTERLSPDTSAVRILTGIVLVLGIASAVPVAMGIRPEGPLPRPDGIPMFEAMQNGIQPLWVAFINPVLGAAGIVLGARLRSR